MLLKLKRYMTRSPNWYLRGMVHGVAVFETTGTSDRAMAEAIRARRESEIRDRGVLDQGRILQKLPPAVLK